MKFWKIDLKKWYLSNILFDLFQNHSLKKVQTDCNYHGFYENFSMIIFNSSHQADLSEFKIRVNLRQNFKITTCRRYESRATFTGSIIFKLSEIGAFTVAFARNKPRQRTTYARRKIFAHREIVLLRINNF